MKTMHVNLRVKDIDQSIEFYSKMFDQVPTVQKPDYAKWLLDSPSVNFSISKSDRSNGVEHLGIQVSDEPELRQMYARVEKTEEEVYEEGHTVCCYSQSEKSWVSDPDGVKWEIFHTYGESKTNKAEEAKCCDDTCCVE